MPQSFSIKHASRIGRYPWKIAMASRRALMASARRGFPVRGNSCVIASSSASSLTLQALATALAWVLGGSQGAALKAAEWASEKRAELKGATDAA